ncbi:hypothetical protein R1sor_026172 [Riccia sorocarpa]|uniref:Uncharacterized protein n=1 Tax=Riccia sorocarpa TaxID=122646 RepID=A0ABD3GEN7_9MARC
MERSNPPAIRGTGQQQLKLLSGLDPMLMVLVGGGIPPARTAFKIQDPSTGRFVWNRDDDLHLRGGNGDGDELLWVLEHATVSTAGSAAAGGYLLRNVLTGKVVVDDGTGGFAVTEVDNSTAVPENHIWMMRPLDYEGRRAGAAEGRLFSIRNQRSGAYIVSGFGARGRRAQLRTRITHEETRNQAWRFTLMSDPSTTSKLSETESELEYHAHTNLPLIAPETPPRIVRRKRSRSGDLIHKSRDLPSLSQLQEGGEVKLHDGHFKWKHVSPVLVAYDPPVEGSKVPALGRRSISTSFSTGEDSYFLHGGDDCSSSSSWMSQPQWKRWISAVSDVDVSWVTPQIGTCTWTALKKQKTSSCEFRVDADDLLMDSPWDHQPKLEETP